MRGNITIDIMVCLDFIFACPLLAYRLFRYGYTFRRIYLGEGFWTILEQADYYRLRNFKWVVDGNGHNLYAVRLKISGPNKTRVVSMHREIMNANDRRFVDHRNCDSLDNRKSNLRFATQAENMRNRRKIKNTSSRFIGAYFERQRNSWLVQIRRNGKKLFIGRFKNEIDAAKAYDEAAKKYHGEFARLNFPECSKAPIVLICEALSFGLYKSAGGGNQKSEERSPLPREIQRISGTKVLGIPKHRDSRGRLNLRSSAKSLSGRIANWLGARLNFPPESEESRALFARIGKSWEWLKTTLTKIVSRRSSLEPLPTTCGSFVKRYAGSFRRQGGIL